MTTLQTDEIARYARNAGFPEKEINTAIGVAMAESGGRTEAHNTTPPDDSYGLWQINMYGSLGPARLKQFGISRKAQLFDPSINAKAAYIVWKGSGWKAWTTYTSGKYKGGIAGVGEKVTEAGEKVDQVKDAIPTAILGVGGSLKAGLNSASESLNNIGKNLFKGFATSAGIFIGLALIVGAILILVSQTKTARSAIKAVAK